MDFNAIVHYKNGCGCNICSVRTYLSKYLTDIKSLELEEQKKFLRLINEKFEADTKKMKHFKITNIYGELPWDLIAEINKVTDEVQTFDYHSIYSLSYLYEEKYKMKYCGVVHHHESGDAQILLFMNEKNNKIYAVLLTRYSKLNLKNLSAKSILNEMKRKEDVQKLVNNYVIPKELGYFLKTYY
mgnify:CR=1 FL=1|jgi:hypothetical protein